MSGGFGRGERRGVGRPQLAEVEDPAAQRVGHHRARDRLARAVVVEQHRPVAEQPLVGQRDQRFRRAVDPQRARGGLDDRGGLGPGHLEDLHGRVGRVEVGDRVVRGQPADQRAELRHRGDAGRGGERVADPGRPGPVQHRTGQVVADQHVLHAHPGQHLGQAGRPVARGQLLVDGVQQPLVARGPDHGQVPLRVVRVGERLQHVVHRTAPQVLAEGRARLDQDRLLPGVRVQPAGRGHPVGRDLAERAVAGQPGGDGGHHQARPGRPRPPRPARCAARQPRAHRAGRWARPSASGRRSSGSNFHRLRNGAPGPLIRLMSGPSSGLPRLLT